MAGETFFVRSRGKVTGPYDVTGLQRLAKLGMLSRVHEISTDKQTWSSAASVPGVLPEAALPRVPRVRPDHNAASAPSNSYEMVDPPPMEAPPAPSSPPAPQPSAGNGPMGACGACGRVMEAALLINDRGWLTCPSCYQRTVSAPTPRGQSPLGESPVYEERTESYHGYAVASLVLGIAGLVVPFLGLICALLAVVFGPVALRGNRRIGSRDGNGMARSGLIMGIISLSLYAIWFILAGIEAASMAHRFPH